MIGVGDDLRKNQIILSNVPGVDGSVQFDFNNVTAQLDFYGVARNLTSMLFWKCKFNEQQ